MNPNAYHTLMSSLKKDTTRSTSLLNQIGRCFAIGGEVDAAKEKAARDPRLTDIGRRDQVGEIARGRVRDLLDAARPQRSAMAQVVGQRNAMKPKALDRTDAVGELRRQELRAYIRKIPMGQRLKEAEALAIDDEAMFAVLDAPAALSGLPPDQYDHLRSLYLKRHFGQEIARLEEVEEDLKVVGAAIDLCMTELRKSSALPEHEFRKLVDDTQAEIDKGW